MLPVFKLRSCSKRKNQEYDYYKDPTALRLVINERLRNLNAQLASILGVILVISAMRRRKVVSKLFLGDNSLGDAGCVRLFAFLKSPPGLHYRATLIVIHLTKSKIGAGGLRAVSAFLNDNTVLRELCLSDNPLTTDSYVIAEFASAINSSHLYALQIHDCSSLGDAFIQVFIPRLSAPRLRKLDISALDLTQHIVPILVDYVKSPQCLLDHLHCHDNSLTVAGSREIIHAAEGNYCLCSLRLNDKYMDVDPDGQGGEDRMVALLEGNQILWNILRRNSDQMERVRDDSLLLLRYCRTLFMRSGSTRMNKGVPIFDPKTFARRDDDKSLPIVTRLPTELQLEIFAYIAPSLSPAQCARVIAFAADVTTLFLVGPRFDGVRALTKLLEHLVEESFKIPTRWTPKPAKGVWIPPGWWECSCRSTTHICRYLRKWQTEMRHMWLTQVVGDAYGPGT